MSQTCQSVTLSLTLPISCQICLGKVRKPKICSNNHVFCSTCIDVWLQKCSQCPTCRVAITPENPCREIIGATNDSESNESRSVKRCLRKTRGELILQEYEDEIDTLLKENEDLKSKNLSLETQLKTALEPSTLFTSQAETGAVDPSILEETAKKLKAANELYQKVKQDMEKLKEANKTLRSQNVDLIQENMRLKAEVESRSPQKFGRYTVAALEAKILQHEREMTQLKKALERSDKYIEELEAQVSKSQREGTNTTEDPQSMGCDSGETQAPAGEGSAVGSSRIAAMRRSLSEMEEASVCTDLGRKSINLPNSHGYLLTTSDRRHGIGILDEALSPRNDALQNMAMPSTPSTPSSAFSSLSLKSPAVRSEQKPSFKRLTYLRRLSFDDCSSSGSFSASASVEESSQAGQITKDSSFSLRSSQNTGKETLWSGWQDAKPASFLGANESVTGLQQKASQDEAAGEAEASEASMDLAYLDKISELDSMMAEGEPSQLSPVLPDFNVQLNPKLEAELDLLADAGLARQLQGTSAAQEGSRRRGEPESSGESTKRKCAASLATASPSKISKTK